MCQFQDKFPGSCAFPITFLHLHCKEKKDKPRLADEHAGSRRLMKEIGSKAPPSPAQPKSANLQQAPDLWMSLDVTERLIIANKWPLC